MHFVTACLQLGILMQHKYTYVLRFGKNLSLKKNQGFTERNRASRPGTTTKLPITKCEFCFVTEDGVSTAEIIYVNDMRG
jgi:hypothetical protein